MKTDLRQPTPQKGLNPKQAVSFAWLLLLDFRVNYMTERENSNRLKPFLEYMDQAFHAKEDEILHRGDHFIRFGDNSVAEIGKNSPEMQRVHRNEMLEALYYSAKFLYSLASLYAQEDIDKNGSRGLDDLNGFINFVQRFIKETHGLNLSSL